MKENKQIKEQEKNKPKPTGVNACPDCGSYLIRQGGCTICSNSACIYEGCGF